MRKYLLFAGKDYYADGGWLDFKNSYEDYNLALKEGMNLIDNSQQDYDYINWFHIVDTEFMDIIFNKSNNMFT